MNSAVELVAWWSAYNADCAEHMIQLQGWAAQQHERARLDLAIFGVARPPWRNWAIDAEASGMFIERLRELTGPVNLGAKRVG